MSSPSCVHGVWVRRFCDHTTGQLALIRAYPGFKGTAPDELSAAHGDRGQGRDVVHLPVDRFAHMCLGAAKFTSDLSNCKHCPVVHEPTPGVFRELQATTGSAVRRG